MTPERSSRYDTAGDGPAFTLCEEARRHARELHYDAAVAAASQAIAVDPNCLPALELRAALRLSGNDWPALVADLTEIIRLRPGHPGAYTQRATIYNLLAQYERAVLDCEKALELDSLCDDAYAIRGHALYKLGREAEADSDLRCCFLLRASPTELNIRDGQDRIAALLNRGDRSTEAGRPADAVQAYSAVLLEEANHLEARVLRGRAYAELGQFEKATIDLLEAWRLKEAQDRVGRGYLVVVEGNKRERLWAAFPDSPAGEDDATALAEALAADPTPVGAFRFWVGEFERAKVYRLKGSEIEVVEAARSEKTAAGRIRS